MRRPCNLVVALCVLVLVALVGPASADGKFHRVPAAKKADKAPLQLRVVEYNGSTNGELTVEVKNTGKVAATFNASGLYFVPDGDPDRAPQRLGAVGPMQLAGADDGAERKDQITIPAGAKVTVTLDVFCIDSHRSSPTSETPFTLASKRMPRELAREIDVAGKRAVAGMAHGYAAPAAKAKIQSEVWTTRDADWVPLAGESAQEANK